MRSYLRDRRWSIFLGLLVFTITLLPYLIGYSSQGDSWKFSGFVFGVEDGNSYIAKMLSGANGDWLFRTPYSADPQRGILSFLPYLLLGKLSSPPAQHEQLLSLFQIFRLLGILFYCLAAHDFFNLFTNKKDHLRWAILLSCIGGGLGWLTLFGLKGSGYNSLPIDLYSPETFGFLALYGLPHLALSRALLMWGWVIWIRSSRSEFSIKSGLLPGGLWLLMGFFQPLSVVTAWAGIGGGWIVSYIVQAIDQKRLINPFRYEALRKSMMHGLIAVSVSCFWLFYNVILLQVDPFLSGWSAQNIIQSPEFVDYLVGFSLVLLPAILGIVRLIRKKYEPAFLSAGFFFLFPMIAYFPSNLQRRLPDGIWWIILSLALLGLDIVADKWKKWLIFAGYIGVLTSIFLLVGGIFSAQSISIPTFIQKTRVGAYEAIQENWTHNSKPVILANSEVSNALPAWIYGTVIIGHGPESVNLDINRVKVNEILSTDPINAEQILWLKSLQVDYVVLEIGENLPAWEKFGIVLFHQDNYWVIKLKLEGD